MTFQHHARRPAHRSLSATLSALLVTQTGCLAQSQGEPVSDSASSDGGDSASPDGGSTEASSGSTGGQDLDVPEGGVTCDKPRLVLTMTAGLNISTVGVALDALGWVLDEEHLFDSDDTRLAIARSDGDQPIAASTVQKELGVMGFSKNDVRVGIECPTVHAMSDDSGLPEYVIGARTALLSGLDPLDVHTMPRDGSAPRVVIIDIAADPKKMPPCTEADRSHRCTVETVAWYSCTVSGHCESPFQHIGIPNQAGDQVQMQGFTSDVALAIKASRPPVCEPWIVAIPLAWSIMTDGEKGDDLVKAALDEAIKCGALVVVAHGNRDVTACKGDDLNKYPSAYLEEPKNNLKFLAVAGLDMTGTLLKNARPGAAITAPGFWFDPDGRSWLGSSIAVAALVGSLAQLLYLQDVDPEELVAYLSEEGRPAHYSMTETCHQVSALTLPENQAPLVELDVAAQGEQYVNAAIGEWQANKSRSNTCPLYSPLLSLDSASPGQPEDECTTGRKLAAPQPWPKACLGCPVTQDPDAPGVIQAVLNFEGNALKMLKETAAQYDATLQIQLVIEETSTGDTWYKDVQGDLATGSVALDLEIPALESDSPLAAWLVYTIRSETPRVYSEYLGEVIRTMIRVTRSDVPKPSPWCNQDALPDLPNRDPGRGGGFVCHGC